MFKRLLIAIDLEQEALAEKALRTALAVGGQEAQYLVMTVLPPIRGGIVASYLPSNYDKRLKAEMAEKLARFVEARFPGQKYHCLVAHGPVYEEINIAAKQHNADLIVVSAVKPGSTGLGPNAARVARYGESSVLIIR